MLAPFRSKPGEKFPGKCSFYRGRPKMLTVTLVPDVIEMMAKVPFEERIKCPICEGEKDPRDWICRGCFEKHGDCVHKSTNIINTFIYKN